MVGGAGDDESPDLGDRGRDHPTGGHPTVGHPTGGPSARSDAELIELVRRERPATAVAPGAAFAELYDRHVESARALARQLARSATDADDLVATAFTRLLEAMRAGRGPTEAFRAYLLTSVRHLSYDRTRAERRLDLTDDIGDVVGVDPERTVVPFADPALAGLERTLAARAFATLPERWQAVLWHLEVEGDSPADIAVLFGLTANAVSALAYRAREGLRQAYLQEHLSSPTGRHDRRHRETEQRLGAYTRGGLAKRDAARVRAHLADCAECRALAAELREVNAGMVRSVVAPLVLGAGLVGYLASRGSPEYLTAMWDPGTGEVTAPVGALATVVVTTHGGVLAATAAGVAGVVGAVGMVGALATGSSGGSATPLPEPLPRAGVPSAPPTTPTPTPTPTTEPIPTAARPATTGPPAPSRHARRPAHHAPPPRHARPPRHAPPPRPDEHPTRPLPPLVASGTDPAGPTGDPGRSS